MNVVVYLLDQTSQSKKQDRLLSRVDPRTLRVRHPRIRKALRYAVDSCVDSNIDEIDLKHALSEVFQGKDVSVCVCCEDMDDSISRQLLSKALFYLFKRAKKECEEMSCVYVEDPLYTPDSDTAIITQHKTRYALNTSSVAWVDRNWVNLMNSERFTTIRTHKQLMRFMEESLNLARSHGADSNLFTVSLECASPESSNVRRGSLRWFSAPLSKNRKKQPLSTIEHNRQEKKKTSGDIERWDCQGLHRALIEMSQHLSVVLCLPVTTYKSSVGALMWTEHVRRQRKSLASFSFSENLSEILETPNMLSAILAEAHRLWTELQVRRRSRIRTR